MLSNALRSCYRQIGRMTIERAYEDIFSNDENEYWSAVRFFRNHRRYMEIVCHVAELDPSTTYKGYQTLRSLREMGIKRNLVELNLIELHNTKQGASHEVSN